jgi:hypothetical protein
MTDLEKVREASDLVERVALERGNTEEEHQLVREILRAILETHAIVPKEPTSDMIFAPHRKVFIVREEADFTPTGDEAREVYKLMLAAAPDPLEEVRGNDLGQGQGSAFGFARDQE